MIPYLVSTTGHVPTPLQLKEFSSLSKGRDSDLRVRTVKLCLQHAVVVNKAKLNFTHDIYYRI